MDRATFSALLVEGHARLSELNQSKGKDYATDQEALSNFYDEAKETGLAPEQVWHVLFNKHRAAITTYVREGQIHSEPIEGRIFDAILYLYLLLGLVRDKAAIAETWERAARTQAAFVEEAASAAVAQRNVTQPGERVVAPLVTGSGEKRIAAGTKQMPHPDTRPWVQTHEPT
jgi:hypothetical protein